MATADSVKAKLQGLIDKANSTTGESDTDLTAAVGRLIEGYGSEGSDTGMARSILNKTITEYVDDTINYLGANAFCMCYSLLRAECPKVTSMAENVFSECNKLSAISFPNLMVMRNGYYQFRSTAITSVTFPKLASTGGWSFQNCKALLRADFGSLTKLTGNDFNGCSSLETVIIRTTDTICVLGNTGVFSNTLISNGTGYVYVPADLAEEYKVATNWVTFADQIRAIEDYPEITNPTGDEA